jgi:hypothetical protein
MLDAQIAKTLNTVMNVHPVTSNLSRILKMVKDQLVSNVTLIVWNVKCEAIYVQNVVQIWFYLKIDVNIDVINFNSKTIRMNVNNALGIAIVVLILQHAQNATITISRIW